MQEVSLNQQCQRKGRVIFLPDIQAGSKLILILPSSSRAMFHTRSTDLLSRSARCASLRTRAVLVLDIISGNDISVWMNFCKLIVSWRQAFCLMLCDVCKECIDKPNRRSNVAFQPCADELRRVSLLSSSLDHRGEKTDGENNYFRMGLRPRLNYSLKRFAQILSTRGFEFIGDNF